jgi:hypothetical protein|tara:strand:- start:2800 stop:2988 length:189 start_codon:yes stop_codon:yes gene_type:complete
MITSSVEVDTVSEWISTVLKFEEKITDLDAVGMIKKWDTVLSISPTGYVVSIEVEMDEDYEQ